MENSKEAKVVITNLSGQPIERLLIVHKFIDKLTLQFGKNLIDEHRFGYLEKGASTDPLTVRFNLALAGRNL
jgi:hypothetical protein